MSLLRGKVPAEAEDYAASAWDRLFPFAWALTGQRVDAEDLVQDTLTKVLTSWERVAGADHRDAYVRKIAVNIFVSSRRRRSSSEVVSSLVVEAQQSSPFNPVTGDVAGPVSERLTLWAQLADLTPRQRAVLVLRYYEDLPDAAIADVLETSAGNVRTIAHRALARLRTELVGVRLQAGRD